MYGWMDGSWGGMALNLVQGPALNFSSVFNEKVLQIYIYIYMRKLFYCKLLYDDNFKYVMV